MILTFVKADRSLVYKDIYDYSKKQKVNIPASWYTLATLGRGLRNVIEFKNKCVHSFKKANNQRLR